MAFRDLVEGECGGPNSLVRLTSHIVQDRGLKEEGFRQPFPHGEGFTGSNTDQLVQQFLEETLGQGTPTFRMDSLLAEMRDLERGRGLGGGAPVQSAPIAQLAAEHDVSCWADQYLEAGKNFQEGSSQDSIWSTPDSNAPPLPEGDTFELGFGPNWAQEYLQSTSEQLHLDEPEVNLTELGASEEYSAESNKSASTELRDTANEILSSTGDDPKFNYSKFMKFMRQIGEGEMTIEDGQVKELTEELSSSWLRELEDYKQDIMEDKWRLATDTTRLEEDLGPEKFDYFKTNEELVLNSQENDSSKSNVAKVEHGQHPWMQNFSDYLDFTSTFNDYKFAEDNPMSSVSDAVAEGKRRLEAGDIPSAVLCFEAAVKGQPDNAHAWMLLGSSQADNEQDPQAIAAYKKCLELDGTNLTALMGLAASYTNENFEHHACHTLKEWLRANPKYTDLIQDDNELNLGNLSMLTTIDLHKEVCEKFMVAARQNPMDIDPDVQNGLGILFNLTNEQAKAVDCFKAALQARPKDFIMWNRLGATLANGGRPEEAVDAYHNALQLYPGFIRARYNLGITCTHLGAHKAAVEHFLSALNQQAAGQGVQGERFRAMSNTIWTTLRLVLSLMERQDLCQAVTDRDLDRLNSEFTVVGDQQS